MSGWAVFWFMMDIILMLFAVGISITTGAHAVAYFILCAVVCGLCGLLVETNS